MRNYFTFDGVDSRSFGVYISGQGTFKAPARSYDALEIPGRNGALLGIDSRLGNVELTYPAFIYSNFAENIAAFRAFLLSHKGYFKLKDSYHPDEFRLAYYPGPFEPDVTSANNAGSFDITFICKPQRYLESGEEVIELIPGQSETHTYTGNPASFVALGGDQITSLQIPLRFYQNLNGYDHPWPGGGGDNKFEPFSGTHNGVTFTVQDDGTVKITGNATAATWTSVNRYVDLPWNGINAGDTVVLWSDIYAVVGSYEGSTLISNKSSQNGVATSYTIPSNATRLRFYEYAKATVPSAGEVFDVIGHYYFAKANSFSSWTPYANICPINGLTGLSVYVSPTQDPDDATAYNVDWSTQAGTVYYGTVDPVSGQLTVDRASVDMGSLSWSAYGGTAEWDRYISSGLDSLAKSSSSVLCSIFMPRIGSETIVANMVWIASGNGKTSATTNVGAYANAAAFKTAMSGQQLVYELATPITYQLTPVQIAALLAGETFVWSSNNEGVTVEVTFVIPTILENPTLFDALPLLRVYGTGILGIGSHTITITAADVYTDIDCEMMDCFKGSANKNQYVQFSGNDFPTLEPGVNGFTFSGITKVEVKPRWWSV